MKIFSIESCSLPDDSLLNEYTRIGAYTDCYRTEIIADVSHAQFVAAFYTTPLFKLERLILDWAVSKPSTDAQANKLASGETDSFAAWSVENRCENQLLLSDYKNRTRSWLMLVPPDKETGQVTQLYFGSAVTPVQQLENGKSVMGVGFSLLLGFHKIYSVLLLYSAKARLQQETG